MSVGESVVVVSGLPRSGTSMMMRMIVAGGVEALTDGVREADADNPHGYFEYEPVKRTKHDPSWVAGARGKVVKLVHVLLTDLPEGHEYRVVLMRRDLDEVIASQRKMLERQGKPGAQMPAAALRRVFAEQMQRVEAWLDARPHFRRIDVDYGEVIRSPREQAERVAAFLGVPGEAGRMAAAVDASLYRNRR